MKGPVPMFASHNTQDRTGKALSHSPRAPSHLFWRILLLLEGFGFDVILACEGREAIEVFRSRCHEIGVVVLDLTMPNMGGFEVLGHLRRIEPRVPVVLASGYGAMPGQEPVGGLEPDAVLGKPYTAEKLFVTLQEAMRRAVRHGLSGAAPEQPPS